MIKVLLLAILFTALEYGIAFSCNFLGYPIHWFVGLTFFNLLSVLTISQMLGGWDE